MKVREGEVYDCNGVPIYCGDLVRSFHFKGCNRRTHYLYHVATWNEKHQTIELIPAAALHKRDGGCVWLTQEHGNDVEVISGYGICFHDRKKRKTTRAPL